MFECRLLRRIFAYNREEVKAESRNVRNDELKNLYSLTDITRMMRCRNMRWGKM
jgi:hypothetical protein